MPALLEMLIMGLLPGGSDKTAFSGSRDASIDNPGFSYICY
jgi:hypothetical protein